MDKIRLVLVDDHEVVRTGLRMLLEHQPDMEIVGEASTGAEALEMAAQMKPDVIVMDITLPDISGIEATRRIKQSQPDWPKAKAARRRFRYRSVYRFIPR